MVELNDSLIILLVILIAVMTIAAKVKTDRDNREIESNKEIDLQKLEIVRFNTRARLINQIEAGKLIRAESNLRKLKRLNDKEKELLV